MSLYNSLDADVYENLPDQVPTYEISTIPEGGEVSQQAQNAIKSLCEVFRTQPTDLAAIHQSYAKTFELLGTMFKGTAWPKAEIVNELVAGDQVFVVLYREMYFRHLHASCKEISLEDRVQSFQNYFNLFVYITTTQPEELTFDLPNQWIWDLVDEFVYQFNDFARFRAKVCSKKGDGEAEFIRNNSEIWSTHHVISSLHGLMKKSDILQILESAYKQTDKPPVPTSDITESGPLHLVRMIGYYSLIGLLRVNTLLGDYYGALKCVECIDISNVRREKIYVKVLSCHVSLFYYVGFIFMMLRRYCDAIRFFTQVLNMFSRVKANVQLRGYQLDEVQKKTEQIYFALGLCISLCPQRIDENLQSQLRDKLGDRQVKLQNKDLDAYSTMFQYCAPKFISAVLDPTQDKIPDAAEYQKKLFLQEVKQQIILTTIRSYLFLYSTISIHKLSEFLTDENRAPLPVSQLRSYLLQLKYKSRQYVWNGQKLTDAEKVSTADLEFHIVKDMVHVTSHEDESQKQCHIQFFTDQIRSINFMWDGPVLGKAPLNPADRDSSKSRRAVERRDARTTRTAAAAPSKGRS